MRNKHSSDDDLTAESAAAVLPGRNERPEPETRLEPDGFDYSTGKEVVVNRKVPRGDPGKVG